MVFSFVLLLMIGVEELRHPSVDRKSHLSRSKPDKHHRMSLALTSAFADVSLFFGTIFFVFLILALTPVEISFYETSPSDLRGKDNYSPLNSTEDPTEIIPLVLFLNCFLSSSIMLIISCWVFLCCALNSQWLRTLVF